MVVFIAGGNDGCGEAKFGEALDDSNVLVHPGLEGFHSLSRRLAPTRMRRSMLLVSYDLLESRLLGVCVSRALIFATLGDFSVRRRQQLRTHLIGWLPAGV